MGIFSKLAKYADRADENFLTESFVFLLIELIRFEPELARVIVNSVSGVNVGNQLESLRISTQFYTEDGTPDIEIGLADDFLVFIEVKHDSQLGIRQLERYQSVLLQRKETLKQLVLLTRSKSSLRETSLQPSEFHHVCWYQISGWLSEHQYREPIAEYLADNFISFLEEKNMSLKRVTWEYINGLPAHFDMITQIEIAIFEVFSEEPSRRTAGWSWKGYYVGEPPVFIGCRFDDHMRLVFENNGGNNPTFKRDLDLEDSHYFSLSAGEQLELITSYLIQSQQEYQAAN